MIFAPFARVAGAALALAALSACQPSGDREARRDANRQIQSDAAKAALTVPVTACSQFFATGALPTETLARQGFVAKGKGYMKTNGANAQGAASPESVGVTAGKGRFAGPLGTCAITSIKAPYRFIFGREAVGRTLIEQGWVSAGSGRYTKGSGRIQLSGSDAYGFMIIGLSSK